MRNRNYTLEASTRRQKVHGKKEERLILSTFGSVVNRSLISAALH
jgi:hypothetical protein